MNYQVKSGVDNIFPIPDILCLKSGIQVGDILICEAVANSSEILMTKYSAQTLNDVQLAAAGDLTRVILLSEDL